FSCLILSVALSLLLFFFFFFSSRRRHTRSYGDWSSDVCSSDLAWSLPARIQPGRSGCVSPTASYGDVAAARPNPSSRILTSRVSTEPSYPNRLARYGSARIDGNLRLVPRSEERRVGKEVRSRWG